MKWEVEMGLTYTKIITVYAEDETEAEEKANEICRNFRNIHDCHMIDIREEGEL